MSFNAIDKVILYELSQVERYRADICSVPLSGKEPYLNKAFLWVVACDWVSAQLTTSEQNLLTEVLIQRKKSITHFAIDNYIDQTTAYRRRRKILNLFRSHLFEKE